MDTSSGLFRFHHIVSIVFKFGLCSQAITVPSSRKVFILFICDKMHYQPSINFIIAKTNWLKGMRKLSRVSMYKCVMTFEVIIGISLGHLNHIQPHIMNELEIWSCLPQTDILCFIWTTPGKSSSIIDLDNVDLSLNIAFN